MTQPEPRFVERDWIGTAVAAFVLPALILPGILQRIRQVRGTAVGKS